jgi:hypothetical protein
MHDVERMRRMKVVLRSYACAGDKCGHRQHMVNGRCPADFEGACGYDAWKVLQEVK